MVQGQCRVSLMEEMLPMHDRPAALAIATDTRSLHIRLQCQPSPVSKLSDTTDRRYVFGVMKKLECMLLLLFFFIWKIRVKKDIIFRQGIGEVEVEKRSEKP